MVNGLIRLHLVEDPSELEEQELEELEEQEIEEQNGALVSWMNQHWTPEMYPNTIVTFDLNKNYLFDERDHKLVERTETGELGLQGVVLLPTAGGILIEIDSRGDGSVEV